MSWSCSLLLCHRSKLTISRREVNVLLNKVTITVLTFINNHKVGMSVFVDFTDPPKQKAYTGVLESLTKWIKLKHWRYSSVEYTNLNTFAKIKNYKLFTKITFYIQKKTIVLTSSPMTLISLPFTAAWRAIFMYFLVKFCENRKNWELPQEFVTWLRIFLNVGQTEFLSLFTLVQPITMKLINIGFYLATVHKRVLFFIRGQLS